MNGFHSDTSAAPRKTMLIANALFCAVAMLPTPAMSGNATAPNASVPEAMKQAHDVGVADEQAVLQAAEARLKRALEESRRMSPVAALPRSDFVVPRGVQSVQLAPDGKQLAFARRSGDAVALFVSAVPGGEPRQVLKQLKAKRWFWSADSRFLWLVAEQHLAVINVGDGSSRVVHALDDRKQARVLGRDPGGTAAVLVAEQEATGNGFHVLRVQADGRRDVITRHDHAIRGLAFSADGSLRFMRLRDRTFNEYVVTRTPTSSGNAPRDTASWQKAFDCPPLRQCSLLSAVNDQLLMESSMNGDRLSLMRWQSGTAAHALAQQNRVPVELVHTDPEALADLADVLQAPLDQRPIAVAYYSDRKRWYALEPGMVPVLAALDKQFLGRDLDIEADAALQSFLITEHDARLALPRYHLYSLASQRFATLALETQSPPFAESQLARAIAVSYRARDGMVLHGFLYLPPGRDARNVPLIANIHGGPFAQVRAEYSRFVQFMVNRGNAVFTPNFRASEGYGLRYMLASNGDFGNGKVLQDVIDGMDWLLAHGVGDRGQQMVVGHSFGGYASLMAATHHPQRFRFALAMAAPTDFGWTMRWYADNEHEGLRGDRVPLAQRAPVLGVPVDDPAFLKRMTMDAATSHVAALQAPIYLWAGAKDDRVPLKSINHYAAQLKTAGKPVLLLTDPESGHNPATPLATEAIMHLFELALQRHLQAPEPGSLSPALSTYLKRNTRLDFSP